jgi:plasmid stabilization system protein ParE
MPSLIWAPSAAADVQRLYRFLHPNNPDAARRAIKTIRGSVKVLALQPKIGRTIEYMPEQFREWLIDFGDSDYVARYHIGTNGSITILAVRHQKQTGL